MKSSSLRDKANPVRLPLAIAAMVGLVLLTLIGPAMTMATGAESGSGNIARQAGYAFVLVLAIAAMRPVKHPERLAVVPVPICIALVWCAITLTWAIDPGTGLRRLALTAIIIWSVFAVIRQLGIERSLLIIRGALLMLLIVNFAVVAIDPHIGIHQASETEPALAGDWRGIMAHKNVAGLTSALTVLFFAFDRRRLPVFVTIGTILLSIIFLWFSGSKTSLGLLAGVVAIAYAVPQYITPRSAPGLSDKRKRITIAVATAVILIPIIHFGVQSDLFLNYVSDPTGLTGRTEIWAALVKYYLQTPVFSAGYGSFWNIDSVSPIFRFGQGWITTVSEGHNGYLDLLVTIGLPGLCLVLLAILTFPMTLILSGPRLGKQAQMLVVAIITFTILHNFTESSIFDRDSIAWVFLLFALAMLWRGEGASTTTPATVAFTSNRNPVPPSQTSAEGLNRIATERYSRKSNIRKRKS